MARNAAPEGGALTGIASQWAAKGQKTDFGITREPEDGANGLRGGNVQEHAGREPNSEIGSATTLDQLMEANHVSEKGKSSDFAALVRMRIHGRWRLPKPFLIFRSLWANGRFSRATVPTLIWSCFYGFSGCRLAIGRGLCLFVKFNICDYKIKAFQIF